jgi:hypothetical protein
LRCVDVLGWLIGGAGGGIGMKILAFGSGPSDPPMIAGTVSFVNSEIMRNSASHGGKKGFAVRCRATASIQCVCVLTSVLSWRVHEH